MSQAHYHDYTLHELLMSGCGRFILLYIGYQGLSQLYNSVKASLLVKETDATVVQRNTGVHSVSSQCAKSFPVAYVLPHNSRIKML